MSKVVFTLEQLEYLKKMTPKVPVTVHSELPDFIHNVIVDEFHAKLDQMQVRIHNLTQRGGR